MDSSSITIIAAIEPSVPIDSHPSTIPPSTIIHSTPIPSSASHNHTSSIDHTMTESAVSCDHSFCSTPSLDPINSLSIPSFASSISLPSSNHLHCVNLPSAHYHPSIASCHAGSRLSAYCYPSNAKIKSSPYQYEKLNAPTPITIGHVGEESYEKCTMNESSPLKEESMEGIDKEKQLKDLVQTIRSQPITPTPPNSAAIFQSMQSKNRAMLSMIGPANAIRNQEERCMSDVATQIQTFLNRYKVESKMYAMRHNPSAQRDRVLDIVNHNSNAEHNEAKHQLEQKFRRSFRAKVTESKSDDRSTATNEIPSEIKGSIHQSTNDDSIDTADNEDRSTDNEVPSSRIDGVTLGAATSAPLWARRQSSKGDTSSIDHPSPFLSPHSQINDADDTTTPSGIFNAFPTSLSSMNAFSAPSLAFPTNPTNTH